MYATQEVIIYLIFNFHSLSCMFGRNANNLLMCVRNFYRSTEIRTKSDTSQGATHRSYLFEQQNADKFISP